MQVQGPYGPPGQMISWVPVFRSSGEVFGHHVQPCPPYTYSSDTVCRMGRVPQSDFKRVPVRVLFSNCTCHGGMTVASPTPHQDVQQIVQQREERAEEPLNKPPEEPLDKQREALLDKQREQRLNKQLEEQVEEEEIDIESCDSPADDLPLSDPLELRVRELVRQVGGSLPGGRLPGSTFRGKAFSKAYQKKFRDEINLSGNVTEARRLAKLAGGAASDKEMERLEREAPVGSVEYLLDELATICNRAVHRQYRIARRAEMKRSGDPHKAKEAARLACQATRLRLKQISGIDNSHMSIHFTDADILNAFYMGAYRRARNRELSCSGDLIKAKQAGRVAGHQARAQTEQELRISPVETRKAFKITPSMAAGKQYWAAYGPAKDKAYRIEMARSGDPVRAESVACQAARKAGREARNTFILSNRLRLSGRTESNKNCASDSELRENIAE